MPREPEPSQNERQFILRALGAGLRLDGRALDAFRDIELTFGDEYGVVDVRLGKTRIHVTTTSTITPPHPSRPFNGLLHLSLELSPLSSPANEPGRPSTAELLLAQHLDKTLRRSAALDTESLCLLAGHSVFAVRADIHVLSSDGNLLDAACLAVVAALKHFRRPDATVEGGRVTVFSAAQRAPVPLSLLHEPYCATFSTYNLGARGSLGHEAAAGGTEGGNEAEADTVCVLDATLAEERVRDACVSVAVTREGEVCQIAKLGGAPLDAVALLGCVAVAGQRARALGDLVRTRLAEDEKRRDGGRGKELSAQNAR